MAQIREQMEFKKTSKLKIKWRKIELNRICTKEKKNHGLFWYNKNQK